MQELHHQLAGVEGYFILVGIHGGNAVETHGGEADDLHYCGHGVGCVLSTAGAGAGAGNVFQFPQFLIVQFPRGMGANSFVDVQKSYVFAAISASGNGAAVEHQAGNIETRECHRRGRNRLVTANDAEDCVEHLAAANEFDGIGNDFAAYERSAHALGAHGFAVRDGDGVELHGRAASGADAFLDLGRQAAQVKVARHGFDPGVGHADERFAEIAVSETDCLEHGARACAVAALSNCAAAVFEIHGVRDYDRRARDGKRWREISLLAVDRNASGNCVVSVLFCADAVGNQRVKGVHDERGLF